MSVSQSKQIPVKPLELLDFLEFSRSLTEAEIPSQFIRQYLKDQQTVIDDQFLKGVPVTTLLHQRAELIDHVLSMLWQMYIGDETNDITLIAVGGYGRGELHPYSDVDILILVSDQQLESLQTQIETLLQLMWDIGLDIGHAVRTPQECFEQTQQDISIATNLMESRCLIGDTSLFDSIKKDTSAEKIWASNNFFHAKIKEQKIRHQKHNNTEYNLEPDIKKAPGGLRDLQMIGWIAKRILGIQSLTELVKPGMLSEDEFETLSSCEEFLWEIRYHLHLMTGRNENKLLFDYQKDLAARLGYKDNQGILAVEQFMKRYYRNALTVSEFNDVILQSFNEILFQHNTEQNIISINERFQIRNNLIETVHEKVFENTPSALLEIFVHMAHNKDIKGVRATTIRQIRTYRNLIDESFRKQTENQQLFLQLLKNPHTLFSIMRCMKRYGVLGRYLPAFGQVIGQMQYDLFHIYTVDAHTLLVIKNMRRFRHEEQKQQFPIAHQLFKEIPKPEILYLSGLFHDIGKGRGGDHSELGAKEAQTFAQLHNLSNSDSRLLSWLVENHLIMSMTAQRKDISDPSIIQKFAERMGDVLHLNYLYLLTVADICATNPELWNGWRASLMRQLYTETKRALRRGLENPIDKDERIKETRQEALFLLSSLSDNNFSNQIQEIWNHLGDDYFLRHSASDIAWHTQAIIAHNNNPAPLILVQETTGIQYEGGTQIFIYTQDKANLFAVTVAALDCLSLNIVDARIMTSKTNFSLDTYIVLEEDGSPIGNNPGRIKKIKEQLATALSDEARFPEIINRRLPRQLKHFDSKTHVFIRDSKSQPYTVLELNALDRPGLLAKFGAILMKHKVVMINAKISTLGERVEDVFFLVDENQKPFGGTALSEKLNQDLKKQLDNIENH